MDKCPNCGRELFEKFSSVNLLIDEKKTKLINSSLGLKAPAYCYECSKELMAEVIKRKEYFDAKTTKEVRWLKQVNEKINTELLSFIEAIPVIGLDIPFKWEYSALEFVTAQVVIGTGLISEILSDITDFFGAKSDSYAGKIAGGEEYVLNAIKIKSILAGGNAVLGVKMSYGQAGAEKGMLMICATATAVKLHNVEILKENHKINIEDFRTIEKLGLYKREVYKILKLKEVAPFFEIYNGVVMSEIKDSFKDLVSPAP